MIYEHWNKLTDWMSILGERIYQKYSRINIESAHKKAIECFNLFAADIGCVISKPLVNVVITEPGDYRWRKNSNSPQLLVHVQQMTSHSFGVFHGEKYLGSTNNLGGQWVGPLPGRSSDDQPISI